MALEFQFERITTSEQLVTLSQDVRKYGYFSIDLGGRLSDGKISFVTILPGNSQGNKNVFIINLVHIHRVHQTPEERRKEVQIFCVGMTDNSIVKIMHNGIGSDLLALKKYYDVKMRNLVTRTLTVEKSAI